MTPRPMKAARKVRKKVRASHLDPQLTFGFQRRKGHRVGRPASPDSGVLKLWKGYSVQAGHVHFIVEAKNRTALWRRTGKLFADRYPDRSNRRQIFSALRP
ncbi:MAG: hypothetical protein GY711_17845 [bacterium]|nr:hypothetical protein [bacterium]